MSARVEPGAALPAIHLLRPMIKQFLLDPKIFNYVIMTLYALSALRWSMSHKYADMFYWLSAFAITATVTFGYKH